MHLTCHTIQLDSADGIDPARLEEYATAAVQQGALEVVPVPTADGIEVYAVLESHESLAGWEALTQGLLSAPERVGEQIACITRFFTQCIGLDEPVPGNPMLGCLLEEHISMAAQRQSVGPVLARLLRDAMSSAEAIRESTPLASGATTPAEAIPEIAAKIVERTASALILGENEHTLPIAEALANSGSERILFSHPDSGVANDLALRRMLHVSDDASIGIPLDWDGRHAALVEADVVVVTHDEALFCLDHEAAQTHLRKRRSRALVLVDARKQTESQVATDSAGGFSRAENVFVYTLSDLQGIAEQNISRRKRAIPQARRLIEQHAQSCFQRLYGGDRYLFEGLIARSRPMHTVLELTRRAAASNANILIQGETGTGKELLARAIHSQSPRAKHPFVVVNCGAIPEELLESELFGHMEGSFTGATADKRGLLEECHRGTLLLDEIGDMSLPLQVKLLRAIQEGEIRPVGSTEQRKVDVRILASTHRDLQLLIQEAKFREDLYYRLNVIQIALPPLRDRREDILPLAESFLRRFAPSRRGLGRTMRRTLQLAADVEKCLLAYDWRGNVRELENAIERAVALSFGNTVSLDALPVTLRTYETDRVEELLESAAEEQYTLQALEARYIEQVLEASAWNYSRVCEILGIGRTTLWRKMNEYGLRKEDA